MKHLIATLPIITLFLIKKGRSAHEHLVGLYAYIYREQLPSGSHQHLDLGLTALESLH